MRVALKMTRDTMLLTAKSRMRPELELHGASALAADVAPPTVPILVPLPKTLPEVAWSHGYRFRRMLRSVKARSYFSLYA